jgi:hypothetical protein
LNDGKTKPFERWQEVFEYLGSNKREIPNFRELPRLFSMTNDIWSDEKGQLTLRSFLAIINIKLIYRLNCLEISNNVPFPNNTISSSKYSSN